MNRTFTLKNKLLSFPLFCLFILMATGSYGQWVQKASGIVARSEVTSIVYNGKLYTFLGFRDSNLNVESSSEVYDPVTDTWTLLSSIPEGKAVTHQGVVLLDNTVWHIGGRVGKHPGPLTSEIWIYNITKNSWSLGPQILDPATGNPLLWGGGGAALLGRTLHVFGGFVNDACNNDQDKYHLTLNVDEWLTNPTKPAPWKNEIAPLPIKRNHFSTVVLGGKIYAIGGQFGHDCGGGTDKNYSHVYNPATKTWTELTLMPTPRSHTEGSAFAIDGKIYVVAGQGASGANTDKVTILDPSANSGKGAWYDDTNLTLLRKYEGLSSKVINNTFLISHGGEGSSGNVRKFTYARTLNRTPVYKFGFLPTCSNLTVNAGTSSKAKTLLFTIDGSKDYTLSSNAGWLTITKNATGTAIQNAVDVEVAINTAGLAPGTYTGIITATGTGAGPEYTAAKYCVNLTIPGSTDSTTLEAENAVLYQAVVAKNYAGYTGTGFVDYVNPSGDYIEWTLNQSTAGPATLQFRYANGSTADRPLKVEVNGSVVKSSLSFPPTGSWTSWATVSVAANLTSGANKVRLTAIGSSGANVDHLKVLTPATLEAENAVLYRAVVAKSHAGYTGTGYVDYVNSSGDYIEWTLNQSTAGSATLQFRYANGSTADRPLKVEVNGSVVKSSLSFPPTGSWTSWATVSVAANLTSGANKVRLTAIGSSGANVDHLVIWPGEVPMSIAASPKISENLIEPATTKGFSVSVAPNPSSGVVKLLWNNVSDAPIEVRIADASGMIRKSLEVRNSNNGQFDFTVTDLPDGLYIIFVRQEKEQASAKLLVKKN